MFLRVFLRMNNLSPKEIVDELDNMIQYMENYYNRLTTEIK